MAESVDALVSNTSGATRAGSTPALGTIQRLTITRLPSVFFVCIHATNTSNPTDLCECPSSCMLQHPIHISIKTKSASYPFQKEKACRLAFNLTKDGLNLDHIIS